MKKTLTNYPLKNSRIVKAMKLLHSLMFTLAIFSMIGRKTFMLEYPVLMNIMVIYLLAFFFIQIPYAIYFRYKYNKEAQDRKTHFKVANKI